MKIHANSAVTPSPCFDLSAPRQTTPLDSFEKSTSRIDREIPSHRRGFYFSFWDVPGVITYHWFVATKQGLQTKGDYNVVGRTIGGLMVLASPVVVPVSIVADVVNTLLFPGKALYRALR